MKSSLSVRIAEAACKTKLNVELSEILRLAVENGYEAICMRASAGGVQTPPHELQNIRRQVEQAGLVVSMVTADYDVPLNNNNGPNSLRDIGPSLDVASALGCSLIRVCLKQAADILAERSKTYGDPCQSMAIIAARWSITLGQPVTSAQVVLCMMDLKLARLRRDPAHQDSIVDLIGYATVLHEVTR